MARTVPTTMPTAARTAARPIVSPASWPPATPNWRLRMASDMRPRRSVLYMPAANERALEKAKTLEESNPTEAESLYRKFLETEPMSEEARVGLARVLVPSGHRLRAAE